MSSPKNQLVENKSESLSSPKDNLSIDSKPDSITESNCNYDNSSTLKIQSDSGNALSEHSSDSTSNENENKNVSITPKSILLETILNSSSSSDGLSSSEKEPNNITETTDETNKKPDLKNDCDQSLSPSDYVENDGEKMQVEASHEINVEKSVSKNDEEELSNEIEKNDSKSDDIVNDESKDNIKDNNNPVDKIENLEENKSNEQVKESLVENSNENMNENKCKTESSILNCIDNTLSDAPKLSAFSNVSNDERTKQPLKLVMTTSVPSQVGTATSTVFSNLKPSLESGGRLTFITFKPTLNSPNQVVNTHLNTNPSESTFTRTISQKGVPIKLLTIPSASGGITVRSATNKLVELINSSSTVSPASPLSPNTSGSPLNSSSPVRLLVSKVATSGGIGAISQTGSTGPPGNNSIGQLVVVKSVVVTSPSPSIKIVPAKNSTMNPGSFIIPIKSSNVNNINENQDEQETKNQEKLIQNQLIQNQINLIPNDRQIMAKNDEDEDEDEDENENENESENENENESESENGATEESNIKNDDNLEPINFTSHEESHVISEKTTIVNNEFSDKKVIFFENNLHDTNEDDKLNSVACGDHNYIMKKSTDDIDNDEESLSNDMISNDLNMDNKDFLTTSYLQGEIFSQSKQVHDTNSRPNKRKSSENAAELIKACMGLEDNPKRNSSTVYSILANTSSSAPKTQNLITKRGSPSFDNESSISNDNSIVDSFGNKTKNSRIKKPKLVNDLNYNQERVCSSDDEINEEQDKSWGSKARLRTHKQEITITNSPFTSNQTLKQVKTNCKDNQKKEIGKKILEKKKKGLN